MGGLYFTLTVFSTVGFGDITASTDFARAVVSIQMIGNLVIIALGGRLLLAAVRRGQARRHPSGTSG
ncbi:potassium channel family protein [Rhodococcus sp. P1Y]|uniref:potassium channel family protein n=1 Tax=Rhodococcus sp. P1Y TaxID=1302308 RepID=UPI001F19A6D6|nr:potassium channel family protein [Rhodococcus sp. P1Y]